MVSCAHSYRSIPLRHTPLHTHTVTTIITKANTLTTWNWWLVAYRNSSSDSSTNTYQWRQLTMTAIHTIWTDTHIRGRTCSLLLRRFFSFAFDFDYWWIDGWTSRRTNDDNRRYHIAHMCYNSATTKVIRWILLLSSITYFGESERKRGTDDWMIRLEHMFRDDPHTCCVDCDCGMAVWRMCVCEREWATMKYFVLIKL